MKTSSSWNRVHRIYTGTTEHACGPCSLYRWEFLRRNPQFRAECSELMSSFGAWLKRKGPRIVPGTDRENWTKPDRKYFHANIEPVVIKLCRKWQISDVFPPELDFYETLEARKTGDHRVIPRTWLRVDEAEDSFAKKKLKEMGFMRLGTVGKIYKNHLLMQFDLNSPMKELLMDSEEILRSAQRSYKRQMKEHGVKTPKARRRGDAYHLHLKVWDLRQERKKYSEIAKLVFPDLREESAISRVKDHLRAAKNLIFGHYREIR